MKIDQRCLISVLEAVEETSTYYEPFRYTPAEEIPQKLREFTHDQIIYHIQYCKECDYFSGCSIFGNGAMVAIDDLSTVGHTYLKEVRSRSVMATIKNTFADEGKKGIGAAIHAILKAVGNWLISFV